MNNYIQKIASSRPLSFNRIREIALEEIADFSKEQQDRIYDELERGVALLKTHEQLCYYMNSYGPMHQAKLLDSIKQLPKEFLNQPFEVIDWGCGQAMGTINLFDYLNETGNAKNIRKVTLIEPSDAALERAVLHVSAYIPDSNNIVPICEYFEKIQPVQIISNTGLPVLHIFSNILDVEKIDLKKLSNLIDKTVNSENVLLCVGPSFSGNRNRRMDAFFDYFDNQLIESIYDFETKSFGLRNNWTYKAKIYKLTVNEEGHLIPIEYYPPVQFQAAYELDAIRQIKKELNIGNYPTSLTHFEVVAPFDLGASVYDDIHPVLAVIHNMIVRGIPTKCSLMIEELFQSKFETSTTEIKYGEIYFSPNEKIPVNEIIEKFEKGIGLEDKWITDNLIEIQHVLSPVAIARFQKVLLEAILTGHLDIQKKEWNILVQEEDVPFASIAIKDIQNTFYHLISLTQDFQEFKLPEINLSVFSNTVFGSSPLHEDANVYVNLPVHLKNQTYDMVVTLSMFKSIESAIDSFSAFNANNNCYFNIRNASIVRSSRVIYTTSLIKYKNLVDKTSQGIFLEIESQKEHLTYFLQLLFRKKAFRPGQLPILDRAIQNLPVIGLLPTGGGKSLTYQIAALLQPGISMVIDPLKSLMKDQYDGLINSGIDCSAFINSTLNSNEKKTREKQLESSELLFVFLSPERLSIASFRERLKHMHDYNVYFSYGIIDEVHCVSEWGHDFRFSYLHLGRNLYNYVKAKDGVISLFGLTATASFDVLADVERELSGNGAFVLDSDVIVRYENTNRLELQYKIERVPVAFEEDKYYDEKKQMPSHLPKAINISNHWPQFDSKGEYLRAFIPKIPSFINELQLEKNIEKIKSSFAERQNNEEGIQMDLSIEMPDEFFLSQQEYKQAGIVFCPHVKGTGLSVKVNTERIQKELIENVGSFTGADDDNTSMTNLESFRDNKLPLMIATKAFGMGIDKPNVRFTVNMNYSSSLEAFVQEAGRAGRDRKIALASILVSDYKLAKVDYSAQLPFQLAPIKNKWFHSADLKQILTEFNVNLPEDKVLYASPEKDVVKLFCPKDNKMFAYNKCSNECNAFDSCNLRKVNPETKGWKSELELLKELRAQNISISKKNFQYLNADYESVMYFFNESFKGDLIERKYMNKLLNTLQVKLSKDDYEKSNTETGFLKTLYATQVGERLIVKIPYTDDEYTDLSKAIYRMCCIELIEDFTQDYSKNEFRIVIVRREDGGYFEGLKRFLLRYYTEDRALNEIEKVLNIQVRDVEQPEVIKEIYRCLAYLTEFVYDKISEKRKRAIDDMRNFCLEGLDNSRNWLDLNESLKDFIYFYFNSKYAKSDYVADNGEPFSLVEDTDGGKVSSDYILLKYLRVIDDDIVGVGTPLDNIKHLYGAVRLISRSLTDSNPALSLLEAFCLIYLGFKNNEGIKQQFLTRYTEGMIEFANRTDNQIEFWMVFDEFNTLIKIFLERENLTQIIEETVLLIHSKILDDITIKYTEPNE